MFFGELIDTLRPFSIGDRAGISNRLRVCVAMINLLKGGLTFHNLAQI